MIICFRGNLWRFFFVGTTQVVGFWSCHFRQFILSSKWTILLFHNQIEACYCLICSDFTIWIRSRSTHIFSCSSEQNRGKIWKYLSDSLTVHLLLFLLDLVVKTNSLFPLLEIPVPPTEYTLQINKCTQRQFMTGQPSGVLQQKNSFDELFANYVCNER